MATTAENKDEKGSIELPAPEGWAKKQIPKKSGSGTSRRNEIVFIAPTGETIKSKKQLDQYLKSHPGGPPSSEFSWSTGETPRRSRRISEKSKLSETESPETQPSLKKRKTSGSKQEENDNADEEEEVVEGKDETSVGQETEAIKDVEMKEVDAGDATKVSTEDAAVAAVVSKEDGSIEDAVTATSVDNNTEPKAEEKDVGAYEMNLEITENQTTDNKTTDDEKEQVANDPPTAEELQEEAEKEKELEAPSDLSEKVEAVPVSEAPEPVSEAPEPVTEAPVSEAPVLEDVKEIAEKQPVEGEDRKDTEPIEKADKDVNEAVFEAAGEMEEKELEEKTGDKKVPALNFASEEETKVTDENSNYSVNLEEKTPQEPKAPQVS